MDVSAGLVPWQSQGPFHVMVKPPQGLNAVTKPFLSAGGESWLREASKKVSETA